MSATIQTWLDDRTLPERAVIARLWLLPEALAVRPQELAAALVTPEALRPVLAALGPREQAALQQVQTHGGSIAAPVLEREFGTIRAAEQYANPRAYLLALAAPPSPTERLFWYGLLQPLHNGTTRSYAIPSDLLPLLPPVGLHATQISVQPLAAPPEVRPNESRDFEQNLLVLLTLAQQDAIDVVPSGGMNKASLLRLMRAYASDATLDGATREEQAPYIHFMRQVAEGAGLLRSGADAKLRPTRAALDWMRLPTTERARALLDGWVDSSFDELVSFQCLKLQRAYGRDIARARRALLRLIAQLTAHEWIGFDEFIAAVKDVEPDFARPHGMYDTWGIVDSVRQSRDGFGFWNEVEGEQIRGIVGGSLGWLGLTDLGMDGAQPISFRLNALGAALLQDAPVPAEPPVEPLLVQPNFEVLVPVFALPYDRFQIGRIAEPVRADSMALFRLTRRSVQAAVARGTGYEDMARFLREASGRELPQNVAATLVEWAGQHGQIALRRAVLLEANAPALLEQVRRDKRLRFPQTERLNDTLVALREADAPQLVERLRKAGYGVASDGQADGALSERDLTVLFAALEFYAAACGQLQIESDASGALRQRVARLLPEKQLNRAYQVAHAALSKLKQKLV